MKPDGCPHSDCARCNGTVAKLEAQVDNWKIAATEQECAANSWRICHDAEVELHAETRRLAQAVVDWFYGAEGLECIDALAAALDKLKAG